MNKNRIFAIVIIVIVAAVGSFYGGMKYVGGQTASVGNARGQFAQERQAFVGGANVTSGQNGLRGINGNGFISGSILSKDATSVTVGLSTGGSKIVLLATSTQIMKTSVGS